MKSHSKKKLPFLYTPFWTLFIVQKRHHRNKYLGLLILNLYPTSKILIHKQHDEGGESDSESNDETESDIDNDE